MTPIISGVHTYAVVYLNNNTLGTPSIVRIFAQMTTKNTFNYNIRKLQDSRFQERDFKMNKFILAQLYG